MLTIRISFVESQSPTEPTSCSGDPAHQTTETGCLPPAKHTQADYMACLRREPDQFDPAAEGCEDGDATAGGAGEASLPVDSMGTTGAGVCVGSTE